MVNLELGRAVLLSKDYVVFAIVDVKKMPNLTISLTWSRLVLCPPHEEKCFNAILFNIYVSFITNTNCTPNGCKLSNT